MKWLISTLFLLSIAGTAAAQSTNQVDLLWEASTHTPPFYRGHSAVSPESEVKVVADAYLYDSRGAKISDAKLDFQWEKDGRAISSFSGLGGRLLVFTADVAGLAHEIRVTVSAASGESITREIIIPVNDPEILLYEDKPLTGIAYHQAIADQFALNQPEITLVAEPYFFSREQIKTKRLQFAWSLNDKPVVFDQARPNRLTLLAPANNAGENRLGLNISNLDQVLQEASRRWTVKFNQANFNF